MPNNTLNICRGDHPFKENKEVIHNLILNHVDFLDPKIDNSSGQEKCDLIDQQIEAMSLFLQLRQDRLI